MGLLRVLLGTVAMTVLAAGADPAYRIYSGEGRPLDLQTAAKQAAAAKVVFLGESHDDAHGHRFQLEFLKELHKYGPLVLSMEMFERDVQHVLDEYLAGLITEEHLAASGRAWKRYREDYKPLVEYAKEHRIPVIGANAPRRYVNMVTRGGREALRALPSSALAWLAPLPYAEASDVYAKRFHGAMKQQEGNPRRPDPVKALAAQSLWDATMAWSIAEALGRHPDSRVLQVNGSFHSESGTGVPEHLERYRPGVAMTVITVVPHKAFGSWDPELRGKGDIVVITPPGRDAEESK